MIRLDAQPEQAAVPNSSGPELGVHAFRSSDRPPPQKEQYGFQVVATIFLLIAWLPTAGFAQTQSPVSISLGESAVNLNGPWRFRIGDNLAWSNPDFDDSSWETVDLTAPAGAHDDDVGLTGYVPGWGARGHRDYTGYAWYRLRVSVTAPPGEALDLAGPPAVDSAYQVFVNGKLLGSAGKFSEAVPTAYSIQPRIFTLTSSPRPAERGTAQTFLIAFRVWMGAWDLGEPSAGGIHIAPVLGETSAVRARYELQWQQTIRGYIVEVVEAFIFVMLAIMAYGLRWFDPDGSANLWLCVALVLLALYRANQAVFFWGQFETVHAFELISIVLLLPLCLPAWTMAWRAWFRRAPKDWIPAAVIVLAVLYVTAQFLAASWFYGVVPAWTIHAASFTIRWTRLLFLLVIVVIVFRGLRRSSEAWFSLPAVVLVSAGLFAQELSMLGLKGIWFPFGIGVSRTQYAYAAFDVALFLLLWFHFRHFAQSYRLANTRGSEITIQPTSHVFTSR